MEDPEELNILRAINRGETRLETVDWKPYLSNLVKMIGLMENLISMIGCAWAMLQEIDDYARRRTSLLSGKTLRHNAFQPKKRQMHSIRMHNV